MAAAFLTGARGFSSGNVSQLDTDNFTISGTDKYIRVGCFSGAGTPQDVSSVVLDPTGVNEALTIDDAHVTFATNFRASVWHKIAPSNVTNKPIRVTWAGNQDETMIIVAVFTGIDQSSARRTLPTVGTGTDTTPTITMTSVAADLCWAFFASSSGVGTLTTQSQNTGTLHHQVDGDDIGGFESAAAAYLSASGVSTTINITLDAGSAINWRSFGAALIPSAGGGGGGSILPLVAADMSNINDLGGMRG